ncbi:MAG: hypothetical protein H0Z33_14030 [Bacillaceae bacterium]|nr:hypothetical protein [Bacillaceae bacterium]
MKWFSKWVDTWVTGLIMLMLLLSLTSCHSGFSVVPDVQLTTVTKAEFNAINNAFRPRDDLQREDVRLLRVTVTIEHPGDVRDVEVLIPELVPSIDGYDRMRSISSYSRDIGSEGTNLVASRDLVFDYQGLDVADLKHIFKDEYIDVSWVENGEKIEQSFSLVELLEN